MPKIKVLEVIRQGQIGGGETHLLDLISGLDKEKAEPICLSFSEGPMIDTLRQQNIKCYVIGTSKAFDIGIQKRIIEIILNEHIQIVHAHGSRAASNMIYPVRETKIPMIYTVHGWSFHDNQSFVVKKLREWSEWLICRYATKVICVSQSNADTGIKAFGLQDPIVIENGINLKKFNPENEYRNLREEFNFASDDFIIGFIARCTLQKSPLDFLSGIEIAHRKNPRIKGLLVGEGEMDGAVDNYISTYKMERYVVKTNFRSNVPELLNCIDVYCLPSLWEGLSIALLEALAMKRPVIVTPTDGSKEIINDGINGLIVPFSNPQSIADSILKYYSDRTLMDNCGNNARILVEQRFNSERVASEVTKIYNDIIRSYYRWH